MTVFTAALEVRGEATPSEVRRYLLTAGVLALNLALALAPAVVGGLALFGVLR